MYLSTADSAKLTQLRSIPEDSPPISISSELVIHRKPKQDPALDSLTNGVVNGHINNDASFEQKKRKRSIDDVGDSVEPTTKKGKLAEMGAANGTSKDTSFVIEDGPESAIMIED